MSKWFSSDSYENIMTVNQDKEFKKEIMTRSQAQDHHEILYNSIFDF